MERSGARRWAEPASSLILCELVTIGSKQGSIYEVHLELRAVPGTLDAPEQGSGIQRFGSAGHANSCGE